VPATIEELIEVGWTLYGAVSHLAIRRGSYGIASATPAEQVNGLSLHPFLAGILALPAQDLPASARASGRSGRTRVRGKVPHSPPLPSKRHEFGASDACAHRVK
jgi:hypothetical protein